MTVIDEIKSRVDIIDIVSETVKLRRSGKSYTGFCPFHENTHTPAFVVFPDTGTWRCFSCNEGGDVFRFLMKKEGWDFGETLKYLAKRAGVELEPLTPQKQAEDQERDHLRTLLEEAVTFFRHHLTQNPAGAQALAYVQRRGLAPETLAAFELGYAPESWDACLSFFTEKGYPAEDLAQAGLVTERQGGGFYDRFRNRLMFPIRDANGKMCGFGARALKDEDLPKYLNSPQNSLFDKGRLLYGMHLARKTIRAQNQAVLVEGYMDVIGTHQAGFTNTVSPMGTALTEDQVRQLKRLTRRMVLALDADAAGRKATLRGLDVARQALGHSEEIALDARGLMRHEARLQADLRVTTLPEGMDPDEVALQSPEAWGKIVEAARPIVIHVMETLAGGMDLEDPKSKTELVAQVMPLIAEVPNAVERDTYRQRLARLIRVDESALLQRDSAPAAGPGARRRLVRPLQPQVDARVAATGENRLIDALEEHSLRLLVRQPSALYPLDRALQAAGLSRFNWQEYEHTERQMVARLVQQSLEQDQKEPADYLREQLPENLVGLMQRLLAPLDQGERLAGELVNDLIRSVLRMRSAQITKNLNQIRFMHQEQAQQAGDEMRAYQEMVMKYSMTKARIDQALSGVFDHDG